MKNKKELLGAPIILHRGDVFEFEVNAGDEISVAGMYFTAIPAPRASVHIRQTRSLIKAMELELNIAS